MMSGCLCTASVEDSYSLWEFIKAAAVLMSKLCFVVKYFPSQAMVAVKPWGSISQFLSVVRPWLCALMERSQQELLQPVLCGAKATEILEPSLPGGLHTPFRQNPVLYLQ